MSALSTRAPLPGTRRPAARCRHAACACAGERRTRPGHARGRVAGAGELPRQCSSWCITTHPGERPPAWRTRERPRCGEPPPGGARRRSGSGWLRQTWCFVGDAGYATVATGRPRGGCLDAWDAVPYALVYMHCTRRGLSPQPSMLTPCYLGGLTAPSFMSAAKRTWGVRAVTMTTTTPGVRLPGEPHVHCARRPSFHPGRCTLLHAPAPPRAAQWHPACGSETCPAPPQPAAGLQTLLATCSSLAEEGSRPSSGRAAPDWWTAPQAGQPQLPRASPAAAAAAATGKPSASVNTEQPSTSLRHPPTERAGRA